MHYQKFDVKISGGGGGGGAIAPLAPFCVRPDQVAIGGTNFSAQDWVYIIFVCPMLHSHTCEDNHKEGRYHYEKGNCARKTIRHCTVVFSNWV